jgi:Fe2+ or Zn2+ uptake regulation protein
MRIGIMQQSVGQRPSRQRQGPQQQQPRTRNTTQRKAVLTAVRALAGRHPTAAEVFEAVRKDHPQMALATVYRALHALAAQRAVTEVRTDSVARYDIAAGNAGNLDAAEGVIDGGAHHHLVCRLCGGVTDIRPAVSPASLLTAIAAEAGDFLLDTYPVQFSGVCPACRPNPS